MNSAILIGTFGKRDEAQKAFRKLQARGFLRLALAAKDNQGHVWLGDPFRLRRVLWAALAFLSCGILGALIGDGLHNPHFLAGLIHPALIPALGAGFSGLLACLALYRRAWFGVERGLLEDHARWLVAGETVVLLRAPIEALSLPQALLLESGEIPPVVFVMHPRSSLLPMEDLLLDETPPGSGPLPEQAQSLAQGHRLDPKPLRKALLLKRLKQDLRTVQSACLHLSEAFRLQQTLPPTAEWLIDNEYILESNVHDARLNLPRAFYRQLPGLASERGPEAARVYDLARELAGLTGLRLDQENIRVFIQAYQTVKPLSIGELWAMPQMLRAALIEGIRKLAVQAMTELREREAADFWANRLITALRRDPDQLFSFMAEMSGIHAHPSPYFASQLVDYLYDESAALAPVKTWLERAFQRPLADLSRREKSRQAREQLEIENAFTSLRQLSLMDWKDSFEELSRVEALLRQDPAGIYSRMDFATRDLFRRAVEDLHRGSEKSEEEVAQGALNLAAQAEGGDMSARHVGTWLIGGKRRELALHLSGRESWRFRVLGWSYLHHTGVYLGGLSILVSALMALAGWSGLAGLPLGIVLALAALLFVPLSQVSLEIMNYLVTRFIPPRILPKMDFRKTGIPDACRTLVVVPMMLADKETIYEEAEKLETRFLANKEANLVFGLFSDYLDADRPQEESDGPLLEAAAGEIRALNQRYGDMRFFLFHRDRVWSPGERKFIGFERKRGKLEELNGLLDGTRPSSAPGLVRVGDPDQLAGIKYVITLDSDTQLPHDTARRMIETLTHPLNQAAFDGQGRIQSGYAIIQPRVSPTLPSSNGSGFSRLFSDPAGIDPYTHAVSDVYQDLTGQGSYHGKGIYDVRAFNQVLGKRFPEGLLLSHDLIEGAHVRVGLASDIELFDEFPQDYSGYLKRQHRWIRGDWQIAAWVGPRVPLNGQGLGPNPLSLFNRWKIADNLRRSLLPAGSLALLVAGWLVSPGAGLMASLAVGVQLFFNSLAQPLTWATTGRGWKGVSASRFFHDMLRVLAEASLLPVQAGVALDAIARAEYRKHVSRRGLLEWTPAGAGAKNGAFSALRFMSLACLLGLGVGLLVRGHMPQNFRMSIPWLALWLLSPAMGWYLNRHPAYRAPRFELKPQDRRFIRQVARRTWRYFSDFVREENSWLPPDNYQVSHQDRLALRTSPTNIGLYLASVLGAKEFGYLTLDQALERLGLTLGTIGKLERFEGHLFNWYDIRTLEPLKPRYVSTVDSGNLLGSLWTMDMGLEAMQRSPLLDHQAFRGLVDASLGASRPLPGWEDPPESAAGLLGLLKRSKLPGPEPGQDYWEGQVRGQMEAWKNLAGRYLGWMEILEEKTPEEIGQLGAAIVQEYLRALETAPSLLDLAQENVPVISSLAALGETPLKDWSNRVLEAFRQSRDQARAAVAECLRLRQSARELSGSMNMRFLYHPGRRLFSIGYNVSEGRLDRAFYDLLATEARLGSFIAIARGDVPVEHWFAMNRPYGAIGRRRALLSWTGTMFEYLMPLLFQNSISHSLLDKSAREAVEIQINYGAKHRVPWGISECAFGDLDLQKTYQYYAFGVPELGLKRGSTEKTVVAPYATLLALALAPRRALRNLRRLAGLGLLSDYGYFEALDFSRKPASGSGPGVLVRAYMAHHQGMSFMALANFLRDDCLKGYFHADARVRAVEPLLHERIPVLPALHHAAPRERVASVAGAGVAEPSASQFDTPHTSLPKTLLLSNGRLGLMLTNAGGGYTRWGDFEITRWQSDRTRDSWGSFCYLRDPEMDRLWCNTYAPVGGTTGEFGANFALDRAMFRRVDIGIESETEVVVAPEDDVEIRRITLINRSSNTRRVDLTSYLELSLAPHNADRAHPAFNKLFIETEALPGEKCLLARRRPRGAGEDEIHVGHRLTLDRSAAEAPMRFETDRRRFIGRGHTLADPMGASQEPGLSQGFVLDPILSLRQSLELVPHQRVQVSLVLAAAKTRSQVLGLMAKYSDPSAVDRAMDSAWAAAQLELRLLRLQPDDARRFQQLASHMLYPNALLRSPAERLAQNRKGQAGLWAYSISGDLPLALVAIGETRDLSLVRQMLQAHSFWRRHGLTADLVILNEEAAGYTQPLKEELNHLIESLSVDTGLERPGGVFLRTASRFPAEDLTLLRAAASVVMVAARGSLAQQLGVPVEATPALPDTAWRPDPRDPSAALPFMELAYFNSLGGFTPQGKEYAIYLGPGMHTPAPWVNVLANENFGALVSETGAGFTWAGNSQRYRLTSWSNDPVTDEPSEAIYLRDEDSGVFWTATASPVREDTPYRVRHGAGYTLFEHNSHGLEQELTVFVPVDDQGGQPVKLQRLALRNDTNRVRRLSVTYYAEWVLAESREASQMHVMTNWDDESQCLLARNHYSPDNAEAVSFAGISLPVDSYAGDRAAFLGRNRSMKNPAAMERKRLVARTGAGLDPCGALQALFKLAPGERVEITFMLGRAAGLEEARTLARSYRDPSKVEAALRQTQAWWDKRLGVIQVRTPELAADFLLNRWLLYQALACRLWGRSAFYQSGGAFGFRDQLQDVTALLYSQPALARRHILLAAGRQFKEGDVQHWWHPPGGQGIRSRISDDLLWLPFITAHYIRVTGDKGILRETVPYLEAPLLKDGQDESLQTPDLSLDHTSLFEHCRRALARGHTYGGHGLPLMGTGDWNDGMNLVGAGGKGESVWLAWFLAEALEGMAEMAEMLGQEDLGRTYINDRENLVRNIEKSAWDGQWYLRAFNDEGLALGSAASQEAKLDSLPQSWAWLARGEDKNRLRQALDSAWNHLVREQDGLVLLFDPPFDLASPSPGYIKGYPPGVRENGGQYTHAAVWLAMAMARGRDGSRAAKILRMLNPIERSRDPETAWRYGVEPYVAAADVYNLPGRVGQGGWSWYTGSAAWMYRAWVEEVLGLKVRDDVVLMDPVIPAWWDGFQLTYRHGESVYDIQVENPDHVEHGVAWVEMDGQRLEDGLVPIVHELVKHRVVVRMGKAT